MFGTAVSVWYQKYIKADRFRFIMLTATNKENKFHFKKVIVSRSILSLKKNLNIFCKWQISIKLFYLYQRLEYRDNYFFKMKFVFFLYWLSITTFWRNGNDSKQPYWKSIKKQRVFTFWFNTRENALILII
jgi:hypothetical protein